MDVVGALRAGKPVLLPTDTVYGLCALAGDEVAVRALYSLKGRGEEQPTALVAASVDALLKHVPELDRRVLEAVFPGAYTLVLENPLRRYSWLNGVRPETIGVRVPDLTPAARAILDDVGAVAATSANEPGEAAAASLDEVPDRIRRACGAELDAGRLPGTASTVIDLSGDVPAVIREGAAPSAGAIARLGR
jgi:tRNA threonylcarbamoyl adenosine modification protein (Sua5/YciO/YrdC/YwlC family)